MSEYNTDPPINTGLSQVTGTMPLDPEEPYRPEHFSKGKELLIHDLIEINTHLTKIHIQLGRDKITCNRSTDVYMLQMRAIHKFVKGEVCATVWKIAVGWKRPHWKLPATECLNKLKKHEKGYKGEEEVTAEELATGKKVLGECVQQLLSAVEGLRDEGPNPEVQADLDAMIAKAVEGQAPGPT